MICQHEECEIIKEDINLHQCRKCGLISAIPQKDSANSEAYDDFYQKKGGRFNFGIEYIVKAFRFLRALKLYFIRPRAKSVLDIGSGRGWMLYFLKKYFKYQVAVGTQISENAYRFSKEKLQLEIYNQDLLEIDFKQKFEVITLWHILEHVPSPEKYLEKIHEISENMGLLIIEVPNFNSWTRKISRSHWLALDSKHHLIFFTPKLLADLLEKYGFKSKKIRTFSLEYSAFTSAQSILSLITNSDNYFFNWLQGKFPKAKPSESPKVSPSVGFKIILHSLLFLILFPICLLINLMLYFSKQGEIINIIAEKS